MIAAIEPIREKSRFQLNSEDNLSRAKACLKFIATNSKYFRLLEEELNSMRHRLIAARMVQIEGKPGNAFVIEYPLEREAQTRDHIKRTKEVKMRYFVHYPGEEAVQEISEKEVKGLNVAKENGIIVFAQMMERAHLYALSHFESFKLPISKIEEKGTHTLMLEGLVTLYVFMGDLTQQQPI